MPDIASFNPTYFLVSLKSFMLSFFSSSYLKTSKYSLSPNITSFCSTSKTSSKSPVVASITYFYSLSLLSSKTSKNPLSASLTSLFFNSLISYNKRPVSASITSLLTIYTSLLSSKMLVSAIYIIS